MKYTGILILSLYSLMCQAGNDTLTLSQADLADKIKGGWAGQVIGCSYGAATEFNYNGTMIQDYTPLFWDSSTISWWYKNGPYIYDDLYMDLTFVDVFEKNGPDATDAEYALAIAKADYPLWHANQSARYNILQGIMPPHSGHWINNPHADDIDFQIEADFIGLMTPGMPIASCYLSDKIGHIMNYGDGWYGGVYMAAMYSLAFTSNSPENIVTEALKTIPDSSEFFHCINDVIRWYHAFPDDWKRTWFEVEKKWTSDIGCPEGIFRPFNIDAKVNAAYVIIGLLYGNSDFGETIDIATRCGQDSDCNPASAGGILGTMLGYQAIPEKWRSGLIPVENQKLVFTTLSLNEVYNLSYRHALQMIQINRGRLDKDNVKIAVQHPMPVKYEKSFLKCFPETYVNLERNSFESQNKRTLTFYGTGCIISGSIEKQDNTDVILEIAVTIDGKKKEIIQLPTDFRIRRNDIFWCYNLKEGDHTLLLELLTPQKNCKVMLSKMIVYY